MLSNLTVSESRRNPVVATFEQPGVGRRKALDILRDVAKRKVTAKDTDIAELKRLYDAVTESYLRQIEKRELITGDLRVGKSDKATRVERSAFWYWVEVMGKKLDYVQQTIDRAREKEERRTRTRREWEDKEIEEVGFKPVLDENDLRTVCAAWNCHKIYLRGKRGGKYCSDGCREEQKKANARRRDHGTYLNVEQFKEKRADTKEKRALRYEKLVANVDEHIRHELDIRNDGNNVTGPRPTVDSNEDASHAVKVWIPVSYASQRQPSAVESYNLNEVAADSVKEREWSESQRVASKWRTLVGLS